jgi:hypothetical protein
VAGQINIVGEMPGAGQKALVFAPPHGLADAELFDRDIAAVHRVSIRLGLMG